MNEVGMRIWFEDGTSVTLREGDTLKCFTATRVVKIQTVFGQEQSLRSQQGNLGLAQGQNWSGSR